jgi:hypothetical protein
MPSASMARVLAVASLARLRLVHVFAGVSLARLRLVHVFADVSLAHVRDRRALDRAIDSPHRAFR